MTAYAIVTVTVDNPETFENYRAKAPEAMARHKAEAVAVSREAQVIEGKGPAPDVAVILSFPDRDHALAWINDPEFAHVHALREASGRSQVVLL